MRTRTLGVVAISIMATFLLGNLAALHADWVADGKHWPTYHRDGARQGLSPDAKEDGAGIGIVWMFPRTDVVPSVIQDSIIDNADSDFAVTGGTWFLPSAITDGLGAATDYYGGSSTTGTANAGVGYLWTPVISATQASTGTTVTSATWTLPATFNNLNLQSQKGFFQVQVYFPSSAGGKSNSNVARYYVNALDGRYGPYKIDQRTGGTWVALRAQPFYMGPGSSVEMNNVMDDGVYNQIATDDATNNTNILANTVVCADAVRVVASTGIQVDSSPAGGVLHAPDGFGNQDTAAVWIGDVEDPSASYSTAPQQNGAIYCLRSDYSNIPAVEGDLVTAAQKKIGTAVWRYPMGGRYDGRNPIGRDPLEGPIEGGIFSSPTVIEIGASSAATTTAVVVGGMDKQVYCVNASTGKLIWKGPGVTISEPSDVADANGQILPTDWVIEKGALDQNGNGTTDFIGRYDAFGGKFAYVPASGADVGSRPASIFYYIDKKDAASTDASSSDPRIDAAKTQSGHMYGVYAWMPAWQSGDPRRVRDAYYGITSYDPSTGQRTTDWVRIDQRDGGDPDGSNAPLPTDAASGHWVRIGGSYWNPSLVELTSATQMSSTDLTDDQGKARVVVADAIMVIPDDVGAFSYSSAVWDGDPTNGRVYIGNSNGRLYSLKAQPDYGQATATDYTSNRATQLCWTFPKVQTQNPASNPIDASATPFGSIVSAPAYSPGKVIVSSIDGKVYAVSNLLTLDETQVGTVWEYDSTEQVDSSGLITGHFGDSESFNASPTIYIDSASGNKRVYIPSANGRLHALNLDVNPGTTGSKTYSQRAWVYPDNQMRSGGAIDPVTGLPLQGTDVPLSPFRFSTAAVVKMDGDTQPRIYAGTTGGQLYGFLDQGNSGRLLQDGTDSANPLFEFKNPNMQGPIMGAVAVDGGEDTALNEAYGSYFGNIFVGTMGTGDLADDGGFFWVNRRTGFSSSDGINLWQYAGYNNLGSVFSSPAVANQYVYVGIGRGRLLAFSSSAFGGMYIGDNVVMKQPPGFEPVAPPDPTSNDYPQVDLFTAPVYQKTWDLFESSATSDKLTNDGTQQSALSALPGSGDTNFFINVAGVTGNGNASAFPWYWHGRAFNYPGSAMGTGGDRQVYYEWGEDLYAIAWNLPPLVPQDMVVNGKTKTVPAIAGGGMTLHPGTGSDGQKSAVSFRFIDNSPGYGSGGTLPFRHPDALYSYSYVDKNGNTQVRTLALCKLALNASSTNPPPPGVDWQVSISLAIQPDPKKTDREGLMPVDVPLLSGSPGSWRVTDWKAAWDNVQNTDTAGNPTGTIALSTINIRHQPTGVNCPLGVRDEGYLPGTNLQGVKIGLAWPTVAFAGGLAGNRGDQTAHFNGNGWIDSTGSKPTWATILPRIYLGLTQHGTNSAARLAWMIDRSFVGGRVTSAPNMAATSSDTPIYVYHRDDAIKTLRFQSNDLYWNGGNGAVYNLLPWDYPPYYRPTLSDPTINWQTRLQRDYPDISRRQTSFQKSPDSNDPSTQPAILTPVLPAVQNASGVKEILYDSDVVLRPDWAETWVEVPQFQPANMSLPGYSTTLIVWLDTNGNGRLDGGESSEDQPNTRSEPYRKFQISLDVPPDYHMAVEKPLTMDITGQDRAPAPSGLGIGVQDQDMANGEWFKQFTVRNLGNVNLYNMDVAKQLRTTAGALPLKIFGDNVSPAFPIAGILDTTPFSNTVVQTGLISSFDGWDPRYGNINVDPFVTTYDWSKNVALTTSLGYTLSKASVGDPDGTVLTIPDQKKVDYWPMAPPIRAFKASIGSPFEPSLSIRVPLGTPTGSYHATVPVFANLHGERDTNNGAPYLDPDEPYSDPGIHLNISVAEDRITGNKTPGSAIQVDSNSAASNGDVQPAAWRDPNTGFVNLAWSTNRSKDPAAAVAPDNPWWIIHSKLPYSTDPQYTGVQWQDNWKFGISPSTGTNPSEGQWWTMPFPTDADWMWPRLDGSGSIYWPSWDNQMPAGAIAGSLRYSAPFVANVENTDQSWLFFQGTLDSKDPNNKIARESRILYASVTLGFPDLTSHGDPNQTQARTHLFSLARDRWSPKLAPKAAIYAAGPNNAQTQHALVTYHGGDAGRWSMFATYTDAMTSTGTDTNWTPDVRLSVPSCLVSTAEPMPLHRSINGLGDNIYDVAYTGAWKYDQSTDIILTRYQTSVSNGSLRASVVKLPRVMGEEMLRDPKKNVYTSEHLSWLRPPTGGAADDWTNRNTDNPFIRVMIPPTNSGGAYTVVNAMDATDASGNVTAATPAYDRASGYYSYTYPAGSVQDHKLGQMLLDASAGIVRFTRPLPPKAKVLVCYTPQADRLTRGLEQDSAPFMFIEKNPMPSASPGVVPWTDTNNAAQYDQIGRRWLFWRKPGTSGVLSSSIYYKTYRIGADLVDANGNPLVDARGNSLLKFNPNGSPAYTITMKDKDGNDVKCTVEISWDGKRIYFPANFERYPGMPNTPGALDIQFDPTIQGDTALAAHLDTLTWKEELPETALPTRQKVNEGQVCAFVDPLVNPTKVWVFWSSTRAGKSDLYYQTISPLFRPLN